MPNVYRNYSKTVLGYVAPMTPINARYITVMMAEKWITQGKSPEKVLLSWNAGEGARKCSKGRNKWGVSYDSCSYVQQGMLSYNK